MPRLNLSAMLRKAAANLEDSLRHYEDPVVGLAREFVDLKLQASIFQYDVCAEMVGYERAKPSGFAASLARKGLVLRLYEYNSLLNSTLVPRLLKLARSRGVDFTVESIKRVKTPLSRDLKRINQWSDFRNNAGGHYGKNFKAQVEVLRDLNHVDVMNSTKAFLSFNMALLVALRDIGRGAFDA